MSKSIISEKDLLLLSSVENVMYKIIERNKITIDHRIFQIWRDLWDLMLDYKEIGELKVNTALIKKHRVYTQAQCSELSKVEESLLDFIVKYDISNDEELFTMWTNLYNHIISNTDFEN